MYYIYFFWRKAVYLAASLAWVPFDSEAVDESTSLTASTIHIRNGIQIS